MDFQHARPAVALENRYGFCITPGAALAMAGGFAVLRGLSFFFFSRDFFAAPFFAPARVRPYSLAPSNSLGRQGDYQYLLVIWR